MGRDMHLDLLVIKILPDMKNTPFGKTQFDMYNFGGTAYETVNFEYILMVWFL